MEGRYTYEDSDFVTVLPKNYSQFDLEEAPFYLSSHSKNALVGPLSRRKISATTVNRRKF